MSRAPRILAAALVGLSLLGTVGCSADGEPEEPPTISGAPRQVAAAVERLERAVRARDFAEICVRLLTPVARERAGGERCEASLRKSLGEVRRPRIQVLSITVEGDRAIARVRTRARGQEPVDDVLELERGRGRYRIAALAG